MELLRKNWQYIAGGIVGAVGGYLYWRHVGCSTGGCLITSSPVISTIWGALLGGLLFSAIFPKNKPSKTKIMELLSSDALVLDVRTRGEFAGGHVKNSKNIPLDELASQLNKLDKAQKIVVVCLSGARSAQAVSLMKKNGFTKCHNGGSWLNFKE